MHTCPTCYAIIESEDMIEAHQKVCGKVRDWSWKKEKLEEEKKLEEEAKALIAQREAYWASPEGIAQIKANEEAKEEAKARQDAYWASPEGIAQNLLLTIENLENKIAEMEKLIGSPKIGRSEAGVPDKFLQSAIKSPIDPVSGLMKRIDNLEERIDQLTNAHNELVKSMDELVVELRGAFSQVSNRINAPHLTWSPGHGMRFERRLN